MVVKIEIPEKMPLNSFCTFWSVFHLLSGSQCTLLKIDRNIMEVYIQDGESAKAKTWGWLEQKQEEGLIRAFGFFEDETSQTDSKRQTKRR